MVTQRTVARRRAGRSARPAIGRRSRRGSLGRTHLRVATGRRGSFSLVRSAQHMRTNPVGITPRDWIGGAAMLLAVAAWGTVLSLLGG